MVPMTTSARVYGGVDADHRASERRARLLEAGLELLGSGDSGASPTIRAMCAKADLGPRYFYESFTDGDALVVSVYDEVIQDVVMSTLAALASAGTEERKQIEVGLTAIVAVVADDPRKGRVLFDAAITHTALAQKRLESARMFSGLLAAQAQSFYGIEASGALDTVSRFLVGGLGETLTAWQHGDLELTPEELVAVCADLFQSSAAALLSREGHH